MAESGGYWLNLAEAQRLTQTFLIPGVVEENIRRGGILASLPLAQAPGKDLQWLRENTERTARQIAPGGQLTWSNSISTTPVTGELKITYDQTPLDHFVKDVYGTFNNYEAVMLRGLRKGLIKTVEDLLIYGDLTYGTNEFDGLHAWARSHNAYDTNLDIDEGGALSMANIRVLEDAMKLGIDYYLMGFEVARRIDALYHEVGSTTSNRSHLGSYYWENHQVLGRIPFLNGIPIVRSDYMVAEQAATGEGSDAMAKYSSGTKEYSIFAVKMGQIMEGEGGLTLGFGGAKHDAGEIFKTVYFPNLENYDAAGIRLVSYLGLFAGSSKAVGRIYGITDAAATE
tara:strand:+ start:2784 stop:3806 length:1023 start_codon:yes stop_codon:yes gene_type:complete